MLLVIFGAGASFDSAPSYRRVLTPSQYRHSDADIARYRPPLADELFDDRPEFAAAMQRYPECQPIIPELRHRAEHVMVEQVLEKLQKEADTYAEGHRQLTAVRYYLHYMLTNCIDGWETIHGGTTNYKTLLNRIHRRLARLQGACLVTFNYDTMLEAALPVLGFKIETISDYVSNRYYKVFKLHGSVNWGRVINPLHDRNLADLDTRHIPTEVIRAAPHLLHADAISRNFQLAPCPMGKIRLAPGASEVALYPALAIPIERKLDFECPDEHLAALKDCIAQTTKLLVIGWRATDEPFLELLKSSLPTTAVSGMVVAGTAIEALDVAKRLRTAMINYRYVKGGNGFSDSILNYEIDDFLDEIDE